MQPVDAGEVAARLVQLALGEPAGRAPDFGGPHVATAAELVRIYLAATGRPRPIVQITAPGTRAIRAGALLVAQPVSGHGTRTWTEF